MSNKIIFAFPYLQDQSGPRNQALGHCPYLVVPSTETFNDIDASYTYVLTPTLYKSWKYQNPNLTYTFFTRSEFAYNYIRGRWFSVVGGYSQKYETDRLIHYVSLSGSTNGPIYGVYFGYGISLKPIR